MKSLAQSHRVLALLAVWHLMLTLGAWLAPHPVSLQHRDFPSAPPTPLRFTADTGSPVWPYVCALAPSPSVYGRYAEDCSRTYPLRLLSPRTDGGPSLLAVDPPGMLFLFGTDEFGRDVFSRVLAGGLLSVGSGLAATGIALLLAALLGGLAGFYGGIVDALVSRTAEFLLALPLLYILLAMRAALPIQTTPLVAFAIAVVLISLVGWARPARLVRGVVLSARQHGFVLAAQGFGAGAFYLIRKHILPQARGVILTQAALLVPRFVLLEVTLSFLGLGVPEPTASWGTMLSSLRQYTVLSSNWWMYAPALALIVSLLLFGAFAHALENQNSGGSNP